MSEKQVPKRFCQCRGCQACGQHPGNHNALFDLDSTGTLKCPGCQQQATTARNARANTTARGYGAAHQAERARLLQLWQPGDACAHCGGPMETTEGLDLAHTEDRTGYRGLAHAECNRGNR